MNDKKASILLHEVLHAVSMYALSDRISDDKKSKALNDFKIEMNSLYQDIKDNPLLEGERGIVDVKEFVAELGNPVFRSKLQQIDRDNAANEKLNQSKKSLWNRVLDAFKHLLGLHTTNSYYQRSMNALDNALSAFDIDTYMRYSGIKNPLRRAFNESNGDINGKEIKKEIVAVFDKKLYDAEMLQLKKDAIANSTFMKAPNGKPSHLNERQWLQVRTQNFKDWFGDWENDPKNSSKVVDENGEPLVVYHGTESNFKAFDIFTDLTFPNTNGEMDIITVPNAIYATDYKGMADSYYTTPYALQIELEQEIGRLEERYYKDETFDIDAKTKELEKEYAEMAKNIKGKAIPLFVNLRDIKLIDAHNKDWSRIQDGKRVVSTRTLEDENRDIDGVIIKNVFDYGGREVDAEIKPSTVYIINKASNVKSANYNTGEFSPYNNEIANYEIDNSNINDKLSDEDKKEILREVKKINRAKRSLINTGEDFLYIVDHTDRDGLEHLKNGQEGFLCKEIINVRGLSKVQIDNIKKHYDTDKGSNEATRRFEHWLKGNGYRERLVNSDSLVIEDRKTTSHNVRLDSEKQGQTPLGGRGSEHLQENFPIHEVKTGYDGTNHPRYIEVTKDFLDSLSEDELKDELSTIQQESADYDIAFAIEEEPKKKGKAIPQDFTFNDGTKVKAPFMPNAQQIDALNAMSDFIKSDGTSMTLSGYAGTGKTSLMEMIAQKCRKDYRDVIFCASTNKAAAVLNDKVKKSGFKASTLNKIFGISVELDTKNNSYNARKLVNVLKDVDIDPGTTVIIDEASMINEENYKILNQIAASQGLKIIYVGDSAQLAPVNENKVSKVFRNNDGKVITLTQVERTDDNAILKEATDIRNGKPLSGESSFNSKGEGVAYIPTTHKDAISEVISHYIKGLKKDPNYFRILAYTNKAVAAYNNYVRKLLGYTSPIPQAGEPMTGYENWGYDWKTKTYRFINSESYKVIGTSEPKTVSITLGNGTQITMQATPLTLEDSLGNRDTFDFMDIKSNQQNREAAIILANEKKKLYALAKRTVGKKAKAEIYQQINAIDKFLFVNDNIIDNEGNYLQTKTIDFGYALTVHKSQGSTFTHVLMDDVDISKATSESNSNPIIVEDVDLDGKAIDASNTIIDKEENVDLGDLTPAIVEQKQDTPQTVNLKQQLEYVGVSRATDTVTIISNDVKKEGSPLHPENNLKDNTINSNGQRSNTTEPHQGFISDGARQLVEHLKSIGINVMDRAAMEKFFKEHPNVLVQEATSNYYMDINDAEETEVLRHDLFGQFKNKSSFGCIGHTANYWYLCDYFGDSNYKVRAQIFIDGNEKLINDFEREIRGESFRSPEDFNRRFEAFKAAKGQHYNGGTDAKIRITTNDNVGVATSELQNQQFSNKRGGNEYGTNYNAESGIETYTTPQGEVYGFVDKDGNIYLDETKISPEHPIHEYTHLWDRVVAQKNQELWNRGVELMKQTSLWNEVLGSDSYGKKWQAIKGISQEKLDSLIASEVHSRLVGKEGADILANLAKEKGKSGIIAKLKQWILDVWKDLKATFSPWSKEELDKLTHEDFINMTLRDLANGLNPLEVKDRVTDNNNINNGTEYKQTDEFRRVQEGSRKLSEGKVSSFQRGERKLNDEDKQRIGGLLGRLLGSNSNGSWHGVQSNLTHTNKDVNVGTFPIGKVEGRLFHDIFETVRVYLPNGELVDLHEDYSDCKCYLSEDGTTGFAIEPDGNLVSVFNLGATRGFLGAIKDMIREEGATLLDAYASSKQNLEQMYSKTLGFHTDSIYNKEKCLKFYSN